MYQNSVTDHLRVSDPRRSAQLLRKSSRNPLPRATSPRPGSTAKRKRFTLSGGGHQAPSRTRNNRRPAQALRDQPPRRRRAIRRNTQLHPAPTVGCTPTPGLSTTVAVWPRPAREGNANQRISPRNKQSEGYRLLSREHSC